jgi:hypothetical protein
MKTFFTIIEKCAQKKLGIDIFVEGNTFVFSEDPQNKDPIRDPNKDPITDPNQDPNKEIYSEKMTIKYQLYFMMNNINYHVKNPKQSEKAVLGHKEHKEHKEHKAHKTNINKKFKYYTETVNNMFLNTNTKDSIQEIFCKSQRTYHAFLHFAQIVRTKQAKMNITTDLSMAPLPSPTGKGEGKGEPKQKNIVTIYQNKTRYPFTLSDIINIILAAITNAPSLFPEPLAPKNPYNNVPFSKPILYHIYWAIKSSNILMPPLINAYFGSNFNLNDFIINNEQAVREYTIKKYVTNSPVTVLHDEILQMLDYSRARDKLDIDPDFPKAKLVEIMKPYLFLFIMRNDGIRGTEKRRVSGLLFKREMLNFIKYNPTFGRKNINPVKRTRAGFVSPTAAQCTRPVQPRDAMQHVAQQQQSDSTNENVLEPEVTSSVAPLQQQTTKKDPKTVVFNTANPGLTISKIEKMYRNYTTIIARNINEYDSESSYDSDDEIERQSYASTQEDIDNIVERINNLNNIINTGVPERNERDERDERHERHERHERGENRTDQELELEEGEIAENDSIS